MNGDNNNFDKEKQQQSGENKEHNTQQYTEQNTEKTGLLPNRRK